MTLEELRKLYVDATTSASTVLRGLALAGLAFVWLFAAPTIVAKSGSLSDVNRTLLSAGVIFAIALVVDAAQLVIRAAMLAHAYRKQERQAWPSADAREANPDPEVATLSPWIRRLTALFWWAKTVGTGAGWIVVSVFLVRS